MQELQTVIRGGTVVTAADTMVCDIGISGGVITALGKDLPRAAKEIDAAGLLVLPGGIDSHCHIEQYKKGSRIVPADTFESGTTSAAFGGTTSVICFAPHYKGSALTPSVEEYHRLATKSVVDYSFHLIVTDPTPAVLAELPPLIAAGHRSIKVFMTYEASRLDDAQVIAVLATARENQAFVTVHAENDAAIAWMTRRLEAAGKITAPYHAISKPPLVEREATHRIIMMSELLDQPLQVFHVTCAEAVEEIRRGQARGLKVFAETCPQYLTLTAAALDKPGFEGAKAICSPALREQADIDALWQAIRDGVIGVVSSDHAPTNYGGSAGKQAFGTDASFSKVPNGVPGLETRLPLLFSEGVVKGRIDLQQFAAITATNPAKLFGLYPRKGSIAIGMDADIAIWDPKATRRIANAELHHAVDYTPYEGMEVTGWPVAALVRGTAVVQDGKRGVDPGFGQFLPRDPYPLMQPRGVFPTSFNPFA
ncbi:dihydropyrimidinase [Roseomonas terrae]|uniref:Dihydropyrimidinase n=1 Tax=Neoroseomonas terrae TaxID=424799 RepID=A0ABS5EIJ2_9PROT|nr:dihydropyrimidinase [Neoroseomonas terrae]MBR0650821.1 dihydropyrimidinase [Neoroseomonas terrae]